ncbi:hypothetical protein SAMN05443999_10538 [Roseovarius azorensis]|uniref:PXPV repeat-containing protein n=1 Tax=Roseovarius azorensis TaxID=1287727 RepID=A0A1H7PMS7_9RHOB|nr:hypothetical protein [Roseovarius azorensis]SEL37083.1 hypothetical protein SAMN05443999_10538 [Roseovarius azorensis]
MHRRFIALIVGTALAVTGLTAASAQAQGRGDAAAIVAGVAAPAIIGATVVNHRKYDHRSGHVARDYGYSHNYYAPKGYAYAPKGHAKGHHAKKRHHYGYKHHYRPRHYNHHRGYYDYDRRSRYYRDQYGK